MPLNIINPIEYPNWNELLLTNYETSIFHTSNWARVLSESYNYKPIYFTSIENGKLTGLIPFMEIDSFLTGKRGVSLPFSDYCQPIGSDKFLEKTIKCGKNAGWKHIVLRGENGSLHKNDASSFYYIHCLGLATGKKSLLDSFRDSTRRNIKKASREGVIVRIVNSLESVKEFFKLNCMTRQRHGLPPQPYYFFRKIHEHIISKNLGFIVLASYQNKNVAGAVFFHFGKKGLYKYGASDKRYQHVRPNNLIMWETIRWYIENGINTLNFGITEAENKGLLQFKRGWGGSEQLLHYYKYNISKACFEKDTFRNKVPSTLFRHLPPPLLKLIGCLSYRHIA